MKIKILAIGKTREAWMSEGIGHYLDRLRHYTRIEYLELPDVKLKDTSPAARTSAEGTRILDHLGAGEKLVLLDENGEHFTSREWAKWIQKKQNSGLKSLVFVIGGAHGFSEEVYARSYGRISMSKLTFPHDLARLVLAEQLYRVFTILRDEGYHHD
ncbi:MAG: 23S rRNA (pseudouridine(1915)-N(3))-methyltransferase RlmH [Flavobacteriales bacterium]|nr:23S rRNA (pseudouridine(1915)-N(3))-methyltransferase RlmH [Flavobacteriales bacterium]